MTNPYGPTSLVTVLNGTSVLAPITLGQYANLLTYDGQTGDVYAARPAIRDARRDFVVLALSLGVALLAIGLWSYANGFTTSSSCSTMEGSCTPPPPPVPTSYCMLVYGLLGVDVLALALGFLRLVRSPPGPRAHS